MIPLALGGIAFAAFVLSPKPKARPVRIALVSDTHYSVVESPAQDQYRRNLDRVIAQVNAARPDLTVVAGDLTDSGDAESLAAFREVAARFRPPVRWVPGNHDCGGKLSAGADGAVTEAKLREYEEALGRSSRIENVGGVRLIRLNASLLGSALPAERRLWTMLEREAAKPSNIPTVILLHYPLLLKSPGETDGGYWNVDPAPRARLLDLAKRMGVRLVLSGHLHQRLEMDAGGLRCFSALATSFGLGPDEGKPGWAMVTLPETGPPAVEWHPLDPATVAATK